MKKWQPAASFVLRAICFLCTVALAASCLNHLMVNDNTFSRLMMHDMYTLDEDIDLVVLGPSVGYASFVPDVWEAALNENMFVLGSSNQSLIGSYYLLKEFLTFQHPKHVIYALHWGVLEYSQTDDRFTRANYLIDNFRLSANRLSFMADAFPSLALTRALFPFIRTGARYSGRVQAIKSQPAYLAYQPEAVNDSEYQYAGKGYLKSEKAFTPGEVGPIESYLDTPQGHLPLDEDSIFWLERIKKLCETNGMDFVLMTTPMHPASMATLGCQPHIEALYRETAQRLDVPLFDFTCCRESFLALGDDSFKDLAHLNSNGAKAFSTVAAKLYQAYLYGRKPDAALFYPDYATMVAQNGQIFNAWLTMDPVSGDATAYCTHGDLAEPEYAFCYAPRKDMPFEVVQPYSPQNTLSASMLPYTQGFLRVCVRPVGSSTEYQQRWTVAIGE